MQDLIILVMNEFGYIGIMLLIAIENIFPPIPSELILTFGGFMTTCTKLNVIGVIIASTIGSLVGSVVLYRVGKVLMPEKIDKFINGKLNKILRFKKKNVEKSEEWFVKRGKATVFFCRFIPIVRSLISIPAGIARMKFSTFIIFSFFGSLIWNIVLVLLGKFAGDSWNTVTVYIDKYSNIILFSFVVIIALVILYKKVIKKRIIMFKVKEDI
ncbi:MAG: DedA family protein [Clostridia bacterium]|nr:DedA family protein [Clostridia bacterium]